MKGEREGGGVMPAHRHTLTHQDGYKLHPYWPSLWQQSMPVGPGTQSAAPENILSSIRHLQSNGSILTHRRLGGDDHGLLAEVQALHVGFHDGPCSGLGQ